MKTPKKYIAQLPFFPGFYESTLDSMIDREVEMAMEGDGKPSDSWYRPSRTWEEVDAEANYGAAFRAIAKAWAEEFGNLLELDFEFESMDSPREYNFTTDRVYVKFGSAVLKKLATARKHLEFGRVVKEKFTSRSGFIPFYSSDSDYGEWLKPLRDWDHNQLMCLIEAYANIHYDGNLRDDIEERSHVYESAQHVWDSVAVNCNDR